MDWLYLLAVQGTLKSFLQHNTSKASILWHLGLFIVQLWNPYITIGKTIALTRRTFVGKVISLLFNMVSRLVIAFIPRSKCLLIFMATVTIWSDFGAQKIKSATVSIVSHLSAMKWWDRMPWSEFSEHWLLSQLFSRYSLTFIKRLFSSSLSVIRVVSSAYLRLLIFLPAILIQLVFPPAQCFSWCTVHIN